MADDEQRSRSPLYKHAMVLTIAVGSDANIAAHCVKRNQLCKRLNGMAGKISRQWKIDADVKIRGLHLLQARDVFLQKNLPIFNGGKLSVVFVGEINHLSFSLYFNQMGEKTLNIIGQLLSFIGLWFRHDAGLNSITPDAK